MCISVASEQLQQKSEEPVSNIVNLISTILFWQRGMFWIVGQLKKLLNRGREY